MTLITNNPVQGHLFTKSLIAPDQSAVTSTSDVTGMPLVSGGTMSQGTGAKVATVTTASCAGKEFL